MRDRPHTLPLRAGERVELDVETLAGGPDALARHGGGYVVLVPGVLPGERVRARVTSAARKFGRAEVEKVLRRSPDRVDPVCRHFLACGGCHWQHLAYRAQLEAKVALLRHELLHALGDAAPPVRAGVAAPAPYGQRHKVAVQLLRGPRGEPVPALHRRRGPELVELAECPAAAPPAFALASSAVRLLGRLRAPVFDFATGAGVLRSVLVRWAQTTGESHVVVVASREVAGLEALCPELLRAGATAVSLNVNSGPGSRLLGPWTRLLAGPPRIREELLGVTYLIAPESFFQASPQGAAALVQEVRACLEPERDDVVADLYCGGGLFALALCARAGTVIGVEESAAAVADAEASAEHNRLRNARFLRTSVRRGLGRMRGGALPRPTLAVLDPPREGCDEAVLRALAELGPRRIAYVACDAKALARDLAVLLELGYRATAVQPVDMFPQTCHVEAVAAIARAP